MSRERSSKVVWLGIGISVAVLVVGLGLVTKAVGQPPPQQDLGLPDFGQPMHRPFMGPAPPAPAMVVTEKWVYIAMGRNLYQFDAETLVLANEADYGPGPPPGWQPGPPQPMGQ